RGLAGAGSYQDAEELVGSLKSDASRSRAPAAIAEQGVRRGDYERASGFLGQITDRAQLDAALAALARAAAETGETDRAETFAASITDQDIQDSARGTLVADHLAGGPADTLPERAAWAEKVALGIEDGSLRAIGLLALGNAYMDAGRIEDARRVAERMLELPEDTFDATWRSLGDSLPEFARPAGVAPARNAVGMTRVAVLFARVGEEEAAQGQVARAGREIISVACSLCRRGFFLHLGDKMLAIDRLRWAEQAALKGGKQAQTHDLLLSIARTYFDKGADEEGHRVLGKVLMLGSRTKVRKDKVRTVCAVGEFFAGTGLALTAPEREALLKLVPPALEVVQPAVTVPAELAVRLVFFHQIGCPACANVKVMLKDFLKEHPETEIQYRELDDGESLTLHYALCKELDVPMEDEGTVPAIFSTERFIIAEDITPSSIEELAQSAVGLRAPWEAYSTAAEPGGGVAGKKFEALTILTVIGGGLADGINPCAFA
ncbi:MAG: hypothetical protein QGI33_07560, partial [Candidatus Brocadiia bacterium]|nr:hypothetical protein [Candidatus Brocadiia bacterium]